MGVPGFYSWLTKRYPMIKHIINQQQLPEIDYLYLDMNGIIYKCVKDDSIIFKSQLKPKELEEIWIEIFNYINSIVELLKPQKMIVMALDGVAPRCKMNNQRSRRFRSAQDYKEFINKFYGYTGTADSQENFKNNSISPGTKFMEDLNRMLHYFIQKKIEEDDYWKNVSVIFTGSDTPGQGEHKIMQFVRQNHRTFAPEDMHCFYGADADLIMLGMTLPVKNVIIIREQYIHASQKVRILNSRKQKQTNFELILLTILRQCFDLEYKPLAQQMKISYDIERVIKDLIFLFFFVGNDFLPRIYTFNIRQKSIENLIEGFKSYLLVSNGYITGQKDLNLLQLLKLMQEIGKFEQKLITEKITQFESILSKEQSNFEDQIQKQFLQKIFFEDQLMLQLKQMHKNRDDTGKINYYISYFQVNPIEPANTNEFYQILISYIYGLKFVYEYYFDKLSSWSWYYPYYFAPLLTDLKYYVQFLINSKNTLTNFDRGQPFQPFKQLMCILPKESAELLPQNFRKYLEQQDSQLRKPLDFYPDTCETIQYGNLKSFEAIVKIPFMDQGIINKVYQKEIENISQTDKPRNLRNNSTLYEFHHDSKLVEIKSPFQKDTIFYSNIFTQEVDLNTQFKWKTISKQVITDSSSEKLYKIPTLYTKKFDFKEKSHKAGGKKFVIKLQQNDKFENYKLGKTVFYGYPLEHSGRIQATVTKGQFMSLQDFDLENYRKSLDDSIVRQSVSTIRTRPFSLFQYLKENLQRNLFKREQFYQFFNMEENQGFFFIIDTKKIVRNIFGNLERIYEGGRKSSFSIIPACSASKEKMYKTTLQNVKFASLQQEFQIGEEVLVCCPDNYNKKVKCGSKGIVTGYTQKEVKVKIVQPRKYERKVQKQILDIISTTSDIFFSLRFCSQILEMRSDYLVDLLGNISIRTQLESKLPPQIDIGLNLISRKQYKLVPNLVRVNFKRNDEYLFNKIKENPFKYLQLSARALQLLIEYKKRFPRIFDFTVMRHQMIIEESQRSDSRPRWDKVVSSKQLDVEMDKFLMKVYIWLVQQEQTHMPVASIFSKQVQMSKITMLQQTLVKFNEEEKKITKNLKQSQSQILINPNFLFSQKLSALGTMYLRQRPLDHMIGDIVVCIKEQFFGHYGVIIGIDDCVYEVLFDEPSFGKNDLGGLCKNLFGQKFAFRQLLNLTLWPKQFQERPNAKDKIINQNGWVDQQVVYYPRFKNQAFSNFEELKVFTEKGAEENKKHFKEGLLDYIFQIQKNLKQVDLEEGYQVIDNKKEDYKYKYNQKTVFIEKEQVQEGLQMIKTMSKGISTENYYPEQKSKGKYQEKFSKEIKYIPKQERTKKPKFVEKPQQPEIIESSKVETIELGEEEEDTEGILG